MDTEMFFPPRDKDKYREIADKAKAVCFGKDSKPACPVRINCLLYADEQDEQYGIWGGLSTRERSALKRKARNSNMTLKEWLEKK
jgi:WhiB family redox-sensing transcriptional regulator